jgi:hypothetical protein
VGPVVGPVDGPRVGDPFVSGVGPVVAIGAKRRRNVSGALVFKTVIKQLTSVLQ